MKVEELASTSLPKLESALNEIEEKFIPASAQSEPVRQRAQLGATPTRSSWLSSLFGGVKAPIKMAQLGASTNLDANAELDAGYGTDPWGGDSKFDDELEMEEERTVKDERRKNVASLHERQRLQSQQQEKRGLMDKQDEELPARTTSFAKGLSSRQASVWVHFTMRWKINSNKNKNASKSRLLLLLLQHQVVVFLKQI